MSVPRREPLLAHARSAGQSPGRQALGRMLRNPMAVASMSVLAVLFLIALFAPVIAPHEPREQLYFTEGSEVCKAYTPSRAHIFGVDQDCRDSFSRLVYGARISLAVGIFTQVIVITAGVAIGGLAGLGPKWLDNLLMRFTDATYAFPDLLLIILLASVLRGSPLGTWAGGIFAIFLAIGITGWVNVARLLRAQILSLKEREFVHAAEALGATPARIFFRHLLPNTTGPLIVAATFGIPAAIFMEAALSYIGIGIKPPTASWGVMVNDGYGLILVSYWPVLFPAGAIAITMLAFSFLGDALRDALDPRARR